MTCANWFRNGSLFAGLYLKIGKTQPFKHIAVERHPCYIHLRDIARLVELQGCHLRHLETDGEQLTDSSIATVSQCSSLEKFGITYADNLTNTALEHLQVRSLTPEDDSALTSW